MSVPWWRSIKVWEAVSWILAGADALLVYFGVLPDAYLYGGAVILAAIQAVFAFLHVPLELRQKGLIK